MKGKAGILTGILKVKEQIAIQSKVMQLLANETQPLAAKPTTANSTAQTSQPGTTELRETRPTTSTKPNRDYAVGPACATTRPGLKCSHL